MFRALAQARRGPCLQLRGIRVDGWHAPKPKKDHPLDERTVLVVRGGTGALQSSKATQGCTGTLTAAVCYERPGAVQAAQDAHRRSDRRLTSS